MTPPPMTPLPKAQPKPRSLLSDLFFRMGVLFIIIVLGVGAAGFLTAQRRIDEIYDTQLITGANVLRALMADELSEAQRRGLTPSQALEVDDATLLSAEDRRAFDSYAEWRMFRVWQGGRLVLRSDTGPLESVPPAQDGFRSLRHGDQDWRIYTLRVPDQDVRVEVGEREDIRMVLVRDIALDLAVPLIVLIPTAALLIWLALNGGLTALRDLLAEVGRRSVRDMSPLSLDPWPRDLHPLVDAINRLFARIDGALQHERRFIGDAAHQLRTPLAAVKLQAQLIAQEDDPVERATLTSELAASVDRASAMTDSLLTLAQLDASAGERPEGRGDLAAETVAVIAELAPIAARRGVELSFHGPAAGSGEMPAGEAALLRLVAANLIENAVRHTAPESEVAVRLNRIAHGYRLTVMDSGPGLPPDQREIVQRRFRRGSMAAPGGAGLGLSIVTEALRLLGGRLELTDRADGLPGLEARAEVPAALK